MTPPNSVLHLFLVSTQPEHITSLAQNVNMFFSGNLFGKEGGWHF